jgi:hypothetical protein
VRAALRARATREEQSHRGPGHPRRARTSLSARDPPSSFPHRRRSESTSVDGICHDHFLLTLFVEIGTASRVAPDPIDALPVRPSTTPSHLPMIRPGLPCQLRVRRLSGRCRDTISSLSLRTVHSTTRTFTAAAVKAAAEVIGHTQPSPDAVLAPSSWPVFP